MPNNNSDDEIKICACRICLDSKCAEMVFLDEKNGWFTLFEYCFGIAITKQDKSRVLCRTCAENVKSYAKFKDQCQKSDTLWKSVTADVKCYIPKLTIQYGENIQSREQTLESNKNELGNKNESYDFHTPSNVDILFTEIKVESENSTQPNKKEITDESDIDNVYDNNDSDLQEEDLKQIYSKDVKNQNSKNSIKTSKKEFHTCKKCMKKYTKKKWYLTHLPICKSSKSKNHQNDVDNGIYFNSENFAIDKNGVAIAKNVFQSDESIEENSNTVQNKDNHLLYCGLCNYNCTGVDNLCKHLDEHWSNNDLACKLCDFVGDDLAAIIAHRFSHFPPKRKTRFLCHICQQLKNSKLSLHFHYRFVHLKKSGGFCSRCNKEFKRLKAWRVHERSHVTPGYICDICGKNFAYKYIIKNHLMNHTNPAQHICDVCGKTFKRARHLNLHIQSVHVTTGPLKCTHCNKMFKSIHTLSIHQKRLVRETPYKCEVCFKGYHTPTFLKSHMVMHSDERPHCCDICGSRYKAKSQLKVHMRKHTGFMPFKCAACSKEFATSSQLKVHSSVHTGVRPFGCMHCTRTFHSKKLLIAHCALHHKNEIVKSSD